MGCFRVNPCGSFVWLVKNLLYLLLLSVSVTLFPSEVAAVSPKDEKAVMRGAFLDVIVSRDSELAENIPAWKLSRKKTQLLHRYYRAIPENGKRLLRKALGDFQAQTGILLEREFSPKIIREADVRARMDSAFERLYAFLKTRHPEAHSVVSGIVREAYRENSSKGDKY